MIMKRRQLTARDKTLIVLEFIETDIKMSDLCRKHNINPATFSKWKTRFVDGGKKAIESKGVSAETQCRREVDNLKQIIAEQTIVIEELKKLRRGGQEDDPQAGTKDVIKDLIRWSIPQHAYYKQSKKKRNTKRDDSIAGHVKRASADRPAYGTRRLAALVSRESKKPVNR